MADCKIYLELSSGAWTDCSADVLARFPVKWHHGIPGDSPTSLVAGVGWASWVFNNGGSNSTNTAGLYTPGGASVRTGFQHGTKCRIYIDAGSGVTRYVFQGVLKRIAPSPGVTSEATCHVLAEDYMGSWSDIEDLSLTLAEGQRADQLVTSVVALNSVAPTNTSYATGISTFTYAFDDLADNPSVLGVLQEIMVSEGFGRIFVTGNASDGETLKFTSRHDRAKAASSLSLSASDIRVQGLTTPTTLEKVINECIVEVYPRSIDSSAATGLVQLEAAIEVAVGTAVTINAEYKDPDNKAVRVGGTDMQTLDATDWSANAASDGSGADLTSNFTVVGTFYGSSVKLVLTNVSASVTGYVRGASVAGLRARGKGLYRFAPVRLTGTNAASITSYGTRPFPVIALGYLGDALTGQGIADYVSNLYGDVTGIPTSVSPLTEKAALLQTCLPIDVGSKITITEVQSGVDAVPCFVENVTGEVTNGKTVKLTWGLSGADQSSILILDDSEAGKLDANALGY